MEFDTITKTGRYFGFGDGKKGKYQYLPGWHCRQLRPVEQRNGYPSSKLGPHGSWPLRRAAARCHPRGEGHRNPGSAKCPGISDKRKPQKEWKEVLVEGGRERGKEGVCVQGK